MPFYEMMLITSYEAGNEALPKISRLWEMLNGNEAIWEIYELKAYHVCLTATC